MSREEHDEFMGGNEVHLKGIRSSPLPLKKMVEPWTAESNDVDINALRSALDLKVLLFSSCLLYTSPSPRDRQKSRMPSSA